MLFRTPLKTKYVAIEGEHEIAENYTCANSSEVCSSYQGIYFQGLWTTYDIIFLLSIVLNFTLLFSFAWSALQNRDELIYSPAQGAISHETVIFRAGFGEDISIYQGDPSPEVDAAWDDLYDKWGIFRMTENDASRLPRKTYPWPGDPGYYIGELAVAHQLHCLNRLRQGLAEAYYRAVIPQEFEREGTLSKEHLSHCVESIRQALICASDISVVVWKWDKKAQRALADGNSVHTCRNFDNIRRWAAQHKPEVKFDSSAYLES